MVELQLNNSAFQGENQLEGFMQHNDDEQEEVNVFVLAGEGKLGKIVELVEGTPKISVNAQDSNGYSPLMAAASYGQLEVVKYLLSKGADVNLADEDGDTALHHCTDVSCMKALVENCGDTSYRNKEFCTPLESIRKTIEEELQTYGETGETKQLREIITYMETL